MAIQNKEGLFKGSKCLSNARGTWESVTIERINEDGSLTMSPDHQKSILMPNWYGVTAAEVSFNDSSLWPQVFDLLRGDSPGIGKTKFANAISSIRIPFVDEKIDGFWKHYCEELFQVEKENADEFILDSEKSYQLFRKASFCAKSFVNNPDPDYYKLYWNQTRMGGREPSEIKREVTIDDAFLAIGVQQQVDNESIAFMQEFQKSHDIKLPGNLTKFFSAQGIYSAVLHSHPNNPSPIGCDKWKLQNVKDKEDLHGDYAITIMYPHQGSHMWWAVFNSGENNARVYMTDDEMFEDEDEAWLLVSPTIEFFFWDLAQTGLSWFQETKFKMKKRVKKNDIGLIIDM